MKGYDVGYNLLGPLFYQYNYRLWQTQKYYASLEGAALYMARGGLRMRYFYDQFMQANGLAYEIPQTDFWCSRIAAFKAAMLFNPKPFLGYLQGEYGKYNIYSAMKNFLGEEVFNGWRNKFSSSQIKKFQETIVNQQNLTYLFNQDNPGLQSIQKHFYAQQQLLSEHIKDCLQGQKQILLIDTGWSGSIVHALTTTFPFMPLSALYFARYDYNGRWLPWFHHIQGLVSERAGYLATYPETAIYLHRHLIENVCEVSCPSTTEYIRDAKTKKVVPKNIIMTENQRIPNATEEIAIGIAAFQQNAANGINCLAINNSAKIAAQKLQQLILYPKIFEIQNAAAKERSKDFGTKAMVPVFHPKGKNGRQKVSNIKRSLWPSGQITVEYPYFTRFFQKMWEFKMQKGFKRMLGRIFYLIIQIF